LDIVWFAWNVWIGATIALLLFKPTNAQIYIATLYI